MPKKEMPAAVRSTAIEPDFMAQTVKPVPMSAKPMKANPIVT